MSRKALVDFGKAHADAAGPLDAWYRIMKSRPWKSLAEIQSVLPSTDAAGEFTIFNIKGNTYRLIARVRYARALEGNIVRDGLLYVRAIKTSAEYDRGGWK